MNLEEYVARLNKFLEDNPQAADLEVIIEEDGYYAKGPYFEADGPQIVVLSVDVLRPDGRPVMEDSTFFDRPIKMRKQERRKFVSLGCSHQNY